MCSDWSYDTSKCIIPRILNFLHIYCLSFNLVTSTQGLLEENCVSDVFNKMLLKISFS